MFKFVAILALASCAVAAPKPSGLHAHLVTAPVAPAVVTAQSSQVIARNYNALATPLVAPAPVFAAAPVVKAAPYVAPAQYLASAPYVAPAPYVKAAAPLFAGPAPYVAAHSPYAASPYFAGPVLF